MSVKEGSFLFEKVSNFEKSVILEVCEKHDFNQVHAARALGINRNTLRARLQSYGIINVREKPEPEVTEKVKFSV